MVKKTEQPHIVIDQLSDYITVRFDDYELFDFVDDLLIEKHNIEYIYFATEKIDNREIYVMYFSKCTDPDILREVIKSIDQEEIHRIWQLNN